MTPDNQNLDTAASASEIPSNILQRLKKAKANHVPFEPAWWLKSPHLQTMWPHYFRKSQPLTTRDQRFELIDGDFIDAQWVGEASSGPIVIVLHGLEGSIRSIYANAMLHAIAKEGWRGLFLHFRNCSTNTNRTDFTNHIGDTLDIMNILSIVRHQEPDASIACVGFSFGANVLLKLLGQMGSRCKLQAGVCVSPPFKLDVCSRYREQNLMCRIYEAELVRHMKKSLRKKFTNRKEQAPFDLNALRWCNNFRDFDKVVTAPLHGFSNIEEYYADSSSYRYISGVKTPSLVIHALDDPLIPPQAVPKLSEFSPYTVTDFTSHGGHLGFVGGSRLGAAEYWLEQRVVHFLRHFI